MDHERVSFNLAKMKKGGLNFELAVDADLAIDIRSGKDVDIRDVVRSDKIFADVKKGLVAPENKMQELFGTTDFLQVAETIIKEGEIQLTAEYRQKIMDAKRKKIINMIATNGIDPKTKLPHPPQRIENAMEEARVRVDEFKSAEEQVEKIVKQLKPVMPISFEKKKIEVKIPAEHAGKAVNAIMQFAKPQQESWNNDGSYTCIVEMPAGLEADFYDRMNSLTHGYVETKVIE
jgi:ribosome maturation protein SDO1